MGMGFSTLMNVVAFPGQIRVMALAGVAGAVVKSKHLVLSEMVC